jgi:hypothetical protein
LAKDSFGKAFRVFVRENISSVELVRILILLSEQPERLWSAGSLNQELGTSTHSIALRLGVLLKRRLIVEAENDEFRYRPDPSHDALVQELGNQFKARPVSIISLIYSGGLDSFSDAFRIGGSDNEDG